MQQEIDRRPFVGWGYESFWLVPGSPAADAPGWVKTMPNGHNGYYDTMLDLGYLGLAFLLGFIIATLHGIGRVADRDPVRAWLVLSLALYIISITSWKDCGCTASSFCGWCLLLSLPKLVDTGGLFR